MSRVSRAVTVVLAALTLGLIGVGCSSGAVPAPTTTVPASQTVSTNDYLPTGQNLSSCVGTLELPNCGSPAKSDFRMYLTFTVLMLGMGLIFWRIIAGIRKRGREQQLPEHTF